MSGSIQRGTPFPPIGPTTLLTTIPSYLYAQYQDDDALQTFVAAFNRMSQWWVDWFNQINLPVWVGLTGALLDWVGAGLYGIPRPTLSELQVSVIGGPYASAVYTAVPYAAAFHSSSSQFLPVTDDIYKRILTWHLYLGDGFQFTTRWLKQRVHRFINGANGVLAVNDTTTDVSVSYAGAAITITLASTPIARAFKFAVDDGVLGLPFEYSFTINLV